MITHTHTAGDAVKKKEKSPVDYARERRARRALIESPAIPFELTMLFLYLHSLQGTKDHAFPSLSMLCKRFGSKPTVIRMIRGLSESLPDVFEVKRGKGRRRTSYTCKDFPYWPIKLIERLEASKPKTPKKPRAKTVVDAHFERIKEIASGKKTLPQGGDPLVKKIDHYMESMEVVVTSASLETKEQANTNDLGNQICASCGKHSPGGFDYKGIWVCQKDSECHQQAWEAAGLF